MSDHKVEMLHNLLIELGCQQCERRFLSCYVNDNVWGSFKVSHIKCL